MTLANALRRKANEDKQAIWDRAHADAETYRADQARAVEQQRERDAQDAAAAAAELTRAANANAERNARTIVATAKAALADRLYRIAAAALPRFREGAYAQLFGELARELPAHTWQRVRVNPADAELAKTLFLSTEIVGDSAIAGGLEVEAEDGRIRVSNTLEARLAAAWPDILPALMQDVLSEVSHAQPRA